MKTFGSVREILDFAVQSEQEAVDFYTRLAGISNNESMREVFTSFAKEEMEHKKKLLGIIASGAGAWQHQAIADLRISDHLATVVPGDHLSYQEALVIAMQKEKAAFQLYTGLAAAAPDATTKELFLLLAMEESKHKLRFEIEYDENVLKEN